MLILSQQPIATKLHAALVNDARPQYNFAGYLF